MSDGAEGSHGASAWAESLLAASSEIYRMRSLAMAAEALIRQHPHTDSSDDLVGACSVLDTLAAIATAAAERCDEMWLAADIAALREQEVAA